MINSRITGEQKVKKRKSLLNSVDTSRKNALISSLVLSSRKSQAEGIGSYQMMGGSGGGRGGMMQEDRLGSQKLV